MCVRRYNERLKVKTEGSTRLTGLRGEMLFIRERERETKRELPTIETRLRGERVSERVETVKGECVI